MKKIYVIRHCEAQGQPAESPLTEQGFKQAKQLEEFFSDMKIDRILSSPFLRAIQSAEPLSVKRKIKIEIDDRLSERVLSTNDLPDWYEKLKATFEDLELRFEGGESSQEAMDRIVEVVEEVKRSEAENTVIVTHGNILSLLLKNVHRDFHFESWKNLTNPDVFQINLNQKALSFERIWR